MAIARRLGHSYRLLLADRDAEHLGRQVRAMQTEGHDVTGVACDVVDAGAVCRLAGAAEAAGPVRALAHVVGLSPSMADAATILQVNLLGPTLVADSFLQVAQPGTAAVFIASLAAHMGEVPPALIDAIDDPLASDFVERFERASGAAFTPGAAYQLSKFGLVRMCRRQASTWGGRGARIVSLSPGLINTPMGILEHQAHPEKRRMVDLTPLRREGTMVEIADAVDFLLSDRASFISGIDLLVDGGVAAAASEARLRR
jgi:NAD(P)-dependent dehydrogenase (short-subunit alcohol dehydrogenase family)